jgi:hypothetical protein
MACSERDENERDIPLMDLLDRWESHHKIQDWYFYATLNIFSYTGDNLEIKNLDLHDKSLDLSNY